MKLSAAVEQVGTVAESVHSELSRAAEKAMSLEHQAEDFFLRDTSEEISSGFLRDCNERGLDNGTVLRHIIRLQRAYRLQIYVYKNFGAALFFDSCGDSSHGPPSRSTAAPPPSLPPPSSRPSRHPLPPSPLSLRAHRHTFPGTPTHTFPHRDHRLSRGQSRQRQLDPRRADELAHAPRQDARPLLGPLQARGSDQRHRRRRGLCALVRAAGMPAPRFPTCTHTHARTHTSEPQCNNKQLTTPCMRRRAVGSDSRPSTAAWPQRRPRPRHGSSPRAATPA